MNTELVGSITQIVLMIVLAYPLGMYIAKVYKGEKTWLDFMAPVERFIFRLCGIDPNEYSGLAFGIGIERIAMLKYGINNINLLYENDLRFLKQFKG